MEKEILDNVKKAQEFLKKKDFDEAELMLLRNLKISDNNFETFFLLGTISGVKKNFDDAEIYLKRAISINNSHINSIKNLAIILKKLDKKKESIKYFKKIIELDKENADSICALAQIYEEDKNLKEAETLYKKVLKINPSHHVTNHAYGKLLLKLNKHIDGLKLIENASGIIRFKKNHLEIF